MRLSERTCEACGQLADGEASAHFARVIFLCRLHSEEFHQPELQQVLRTPGASTRAIWAAIDMWLRTSITMRLVSSRLRLVRFSPEEPPEHAFTSRGPSDNLCVICGDVDGQGAHRELRHAFRPADVVVSS